MDHTQSIIASLVLGTMIVLVAFSIKKNHTRRQFLSLFSLGAVLLASGITRVTVAEGDQSIPPMTVPTPQESPLSEDAVIEEVVDTGMEEANEGLMTEDIEEEFLLEDGEIDLEEDLMVEDTVEELSPVEENQILTETEEEPITSELETAFYSQPQEFVISSESKDHPLAVYWVSKTNQTTLTKAELLDFYQTVVQSAEKDWVTLVLGNGKGLMFLDSTASFLYGSLDEQHGVSDFMGMGLIFEDRVEYQFN